MRRSLALAALMLALSAAPALADPQDRVESAGDMLRESLAAFGRLDPYGMYGSVAAWEDRETAWTYGMYDYASGWAEDEAYATAGPVGGLVVGTAAQVLGIVGENVAANDAAARAGVNTCFQGWFPTFPEMWTPLRNICLAQRQAAETLLGQPLPAL